MFDMSWRIHAYVRVYGTVAYILKIPDVTSRCGFEINPFRPQKKKKVCFNIRLCGARKVYV